jgi:hypothetical protein
MLWNLLRLEHHESLFMPRSGSSFRGKQSREIPKALAFVKAKLYLVKN